MRWDEMWCDVMWCGVMWCEVMWCYVMWCGVVWKAVRWCGVMWCGVIGCDVMWCDVVWCGVVWCDVRWCGVMWCDAMWCGVIGCDVMWCDVMWCDVKWCDVMWCDDCDVVWSDVVWCDVMWWDVMWCDVMWCDWMWCVVSYFSYGSDPHQKRVSVLISKASSVFLSLPPQINFSPIKISRFRLASVNIEVRPFWHLPPDVLTIQSHFCKWWFIFSRYYSVTVRAFSTATHLWNVWKPRDVSLACTAIAIVSCGFLSKRIRMEISTRDRVFSFCVFLFWAVSACHNNAAIFWKILSFSLSLSLNNCSLWFLSVLILGRRERWRTRDWKTVNWFI